MKNNKKVLYLFGQPVNKRNIDRLGIRNFQQKGYHVEIWDFTKFLYQDVWEQYISGNPEEITFPNYHLINKQNDFLILLDRNGPFNFVVDVIDSYHYNYLLVKYKLLTRGAYVLHLSLGGLPLPELGPLELLSGRIRKYISSPGLALQVAWNHFQRNLFNRFIKKFSGQMLIAIGGEVSRRSALSRGFGENQIIRAHNLDYDLFLHVKKLPVSDHQPYLVFLDDDYAFHPDYIYMGIQPAATPEQYFPTIVSALNFFGRAYDLEAKVAAHPRARYNSMEIKYFEDIPVYDHKTADLIRDADLVICHSSTAIQLAILFEKPIIFVTTDEIIKSPLGIEIDEYARSVNKLAINLNSELEKINLQGEIYIDKKAYTKLVTDYVKLPNTAEKPCWDIIAESLENLCDEKSSKSR